MRQVTRKGLITMAAAGGALVLSGGYAHADAGAAGGASNSPGVLSGNSIQVPIDIPVNACGNSVSAGGLLNPATGNDCGNGSAGAPAGTSSDGAHADDSSAARSSGSHAGSRDSGQHRTGPNGEGTGRHRATGATAEGHAKGSPGIGSGNQLQVPVEIPVNLCGNSVTIGGLLNPVFGNSCANDAEVSPPPPETPVTPDRPAEPPRHVPPAPHAPEAQLLPGEQLAQTGAGGLALLIPASAGLLFAGAGTVLYRRSRSAV